MKQKKKINLLNKSTDSKFVKKELNIVNDQSNANYDVGNLITHNTEILNLIFVITIMLIS